MKKIKKWISEHKSEPTFKHVTLIFVLILIAIAVQIFNNFRDSWDEKPVTSETVVEETEEEKILLSRLSTTVRDISLCFV